MNPEKPLDCLVVGEAAVDLLMDRTAELEVGKEKLVERMEFALGASSSITAFNLARFNVGFLSRFVQGESRRECARAGLRAASRCVTRFGGTAAFEGKCGV